MATLNKGFLFSTNIKQAFNLEHPHKSSRLAEKKATIQYVDKSTAEQVVGDSLVHTEPSTDLTGISKCSILNVFATLPYNYSKLHI